MREEGIKIIPYSNKYIDDFARLNFEWLEKHFYIEDYDREVLTDPEKNILTPGGYVLFAVKEGKAIGTVALIKRNEGVFELSKMGVTKLFQGKGIGILLMNACIEYAKNKKCTQLFLDSNRKLVPAITLYKKLGFKEIPVPKDTPYERCDIRMEIELS